MIEFNKPAPKPAGIKAAIRELPVGQLMVVWMSDYQRSTVTNAASLAGREIGGKFSVHCDWDNSRFIITRTA
jgi:hypothetical protein